MNFCPSCGRQGYTKIYDELIPVNRVQTMNSCLSKILPAKYSLRLNAYTYKQNLPLNDPQRLIRHKTQPTNQLLVRLQLWRSEEYFFIDFMLKSSPPFRVSSLVQIELLKIMVSYRFGWFLCLIAYRPLYVIWCRSYSPRRTVVALFNPIAGRIRGFISFPRVFARKWT